MSHILIGLLGVLVGALIGHRLALGRDRRKEYNEVIIPMRKKLIKQLNCLRNEEYSNGLVYSDICCLEANLTGKKFKRIQEIYTNYNLYGSKSGELDQWNGVFNKNEEFFNKFVI